MKENLDTSIDLALRLRKMCETARKICQDVIEQNPDINDELSLLVVGLYNGVGNVQVKLDDHLALLSERMSILGKEGVEKKLQIKFGNEEAKEPDDEEDTPLDPYDD